MKAKLHLFILATAPVTLPVYAFGFVIGVLWVPVRAGFETAEKFWDYILMPYWMHPK